MEAQELPLVTVVTVVFNGRDVIQRTIESVLAQTYPHIEYIVIDGGSTDGTMEVIDRYRSRISYVASEPDGGIYDAMNKGIAKAQGQWINFMNAGDCFFNEKSVADAALCMGGSAMILYGGVEIRYPQYSRLQQPGSPEHLWTGMQFSHQSAFVRTSYHKKHLYDLAHPVTADLAFMYAAYRAHQKFEDTHLVIASVMTGGVSESHRVRTILACADAVCGRDFRPFVRLFYWMKVVDAVCRSLLRQLLPASVVRRIILSK